MPRTPDRRHGLTLTELIITIVFLSILLGAIWMIYQGMFKSTYSQEKRTGIKAEMAHGFPTLALDLREASSLASAQQTSLTLQRDTDDNGVDETIQYTWSGTSGAPLQRVADVTIPLVNFVSSLAFSYYDANNNLLSFPVTASQVRLVAVNVTAANQDETLQLRSQTRLRNLS